LGIWGFGDLGFVELFAALAGDLRRSGQQVIDSAASMAANYRAACRARSRAEFIAKLGTVNEECDETVYWLEYVARTGMIFKGLGDLLDEAQQLRAIFAASYGTARANYQGATKSPNPKIPRSPKSRDH
jgi:four helix bundle protein